MWLGLAALFGILGFVVATGNTPEFLNSKLLGLPDVEPDNQKGTYRRDYDDIFEFWASQTNVPFALIKAHAIRESSLKPNAFLGDWRGGSYGLMQLSYGSSTSERFSKFGWPASKIGKPETLYDVDINVEIGAKLIADNLKSFGNLKDAINAYNTGKRYDVSRAPYNYTEDVLNYYETLIGRKI